MRSRPKWALHEKTVETHEMDTTLLTRSLKAEHALETAAAAGEEGNRRVRAIDV